VTTVEVIGTVVLSLAAACIVVASRWAAEHLAGKVGEQILDRHRNTPGGNGPHLPRQ
jgi:hypothetical protein